MEKIKVSKIELTRATGRVDEHENKTTADSIFIANQILYDYSRTAPMSEDGYDKVYFAIVFEDGEEYTGIYELTKDGSFPNIMKHIYEHCLFVLGKNKPVYMNEGQYKYYLEKVYGKEYTDSYTMFLQNYDLTYNVKVV
jgi:hypothetical protein